MDARPFEVSIPQEKIDDLRERPARTRWPDEVAGAGWDYGSNLAYMKGETLSIPNPKSEGKNQRGHLLWPPGLATPARAYGGHRLVAKR